MDKCVYVHKLDGVVVYVGSGSKKRVKSKSDRSEDHLKLWELLVKEIVATNLTANQSKILEKQLIDQNKNNNLFLNKSKNTNLTIALNWEILNSLVYYDENCPTNLRWKTSGNGRIENEQAGGHSGKYARVSVNGKLMQLHRVVYCVYHKVDIDNYMVIDHIDRNPFNNKIENLRLISPSENNKNRVRLINELGEPNISKSSKHDSFLLQWVENGFPKRMRFNYTGNSRLKDKNHYDSKELAFEASILVRDMLVDSGHIKL